MTGGTQRPGQRLFLREGPVRPINVGGTDGRLSVALRWQCGPLGALCQSQRAKGSAAWSAEQGLRAAAPPLERHRGAGNRSLERAQALETHGHNGDLVLVFGDWSFAPTTLFRQGQSFNVIFSAEMVVSAPVSLVPSKLRHGKARCLAHGGHLREMHCSSQLPPSQLFTTMFHLEVYLSWVMRLEVIDKRPVA